MTGTVTDANTLETLPGANVYFKNSGGTQIGTTTDVNGRFNLPGATNQIVFVTFVGYLGKAFQGVDGEVSVALSPSSEELPELIVRPEPKGVPAWAIVAGVLLLGYAVSQR